MTRALLERCRRNIWGAIVYNRKQADEKHDLIDAIDAELAKPARQERKHTEAEVNTMNDKINLPPLLNPVRVLNDCTDEYEEFWDADDVKSYATAAVLADRAAQQERKPHTEAEVQQILSIGPMRSEFADHLEALVRNILKVPAL